ncbi:hypothetical protein ACTFIV_008882 [Dictyostelium citrinum]
MDSYHCESLEGFLLNSETDILDCLNVVVDYLGTETDANQVINHPLDQIELPNISNNENINISSTSLFSNAPSFDMNGYSDLTSLLNSIHSFSRQNKIIELEKAHSWEKIVLLYKSLPIDGTFLKNNAEARIMIARHIIYYKNTLKQLINYYLDNEMIDLEKWNAAIENNKILLHQRLKNIRDLSKSNPTVSSEKDFCDRLQLPLIYQ